MSTPARNIEPMSEEKRKVTILGRDTRQQENQDDER